MLGTQPFAPDRLPIGVELLDYATAVAEPAIRQARHQAEALWGPYSTNLPAPECRRRLEPPPFPAQRFRHRNLVAGLPAGHRADGKMKRGLIVLPDGTEQCTGTCDVARTSQTFLEPDEPRHVALDGCMCRVEWQEEFRRIAQLLEVDPETVL